jgi:hypothetical protein
MFKNLAIRAEDLVSTIADNPENMVAWLRLQTVANRAVFELARCCDAEDIDDIYVPEVSNECLK